MINLDHIHVYIKYFGEKIIILSIRVWYKIRNSKLLFKRHLKFALQYRNYALHLIRLYTY